MKSRDRKLANEVESSHFWWTFLPLALGAAAGAGVTQPWSLTGQETRLCLRNEISQQFQPPGRPRAQLGPSGLDAARRAMKSFSHPIPSSSPSPGNGSWIPPGSAWRSHPEGPPITSPLGVFCLERSFDAGNTL